MSRQHLNMLNSFELNNIQIKSFKTTQNLFTIDKYAKVFTQFFCFLFRTASVTNKELTFTSAIELASSKDEKRSLKKLFHLSMMYLILLFLIQMNLSQMIKKQLSQKEERIILQVQSLIHQMMIQT